MVQAVFVQSLLKSKYPHITFACKGMTTTGDQILDVPLSAIGEKALFTKELEVALAEKEVDLVVHSLKDMPTTLPTGMLLTAILERHDPSDVVVMSIKNQGKTLNDLPDGSIIGTSSVRRSAQLKRAFGNLKFKDIRGNLNTRLAKLDAPESPFSAILLAYAGISRLGWCHRISEVLQPEVMLHAVGQGALGIECRADDLEIIELLKVLNHVDTELRCLAERGFMRTLEGGCSVPLGVYSEISANVLNLTGSVTSLDGFQQLKHKLSSKLAETYDEMRLQAELLGTDLAQELLRQGARKMLDAIKK